MFRAFIVQLSEFTDLGRSRAMRFSVSMMMIVCLYAFTACRCSEPPTASALGLKSLKTNRTISGSVLQNFSYCGGAAPPQELLDKLAIPVAFANKNFYIRKGTVNSTTAELVSSFTTKDDGSFQFELPEGDYSIIVEEQLKEIQAKDYITETQTIDLQCAEEWWKKPYYSLTVSDKDTTQLQFLFEKRCFVDSDIPCVSFRGLLPP